MGNFADDDGRHLQGDLLQLKELVDRELDSYLPKPQERPASLHKALRYSVFAGGKRLRPILTMLAAQTVGFEPERLAGPASAVELLHTYTLIHDDLPCMDDDDLRRGKPSAHKAFGEAVALLAGDALLTGAFGMLIETAGRAGFPAEAISRVALELAQAAGSLGIIAGQIEDLAAEGRDIGLDELQYIHSRKTGDLFEYSCRAGAILAGASDQDIEKLSRFGELFGLLFQITDDILDEVGDQSKLGKPTGSDKESQKATYPSMLTLDGAWRIAESTGSEACEFLVDLPGDRVKVQVLDHLTVRTHVSMI